MFHKQFPARKYKDSIPINLTLPKQNIQKILYLSQPSNEMCSKLKHCASCELLVLRNDEFVQISNYTLHQRQQDLKFEIILLSSDTRYKYTTLECSRVFINISTKNLNLDLSPKYFYG